MTTPSTTITMLDIQNEFGGAAPISLSEYYKGGGYVNAGVTAAIPTSGQISMDQLRNVTNRPVDLGTVSDLGSFAGTSWNQGWTEATGGGGRNGNVTYTNYSVSAQGYPLMTGAYNYEDTAQLGGNRSGGVTLASYGGRDYRGRPSPTFTISNPQFLTAQFRIQTAWISHSHTRINWMLYESNGTLLSQTGYIDYNFNTNRANPGGQGTTTDTVVNISPNSSRTFYVRADGYWNGDYDYAPHWWSNISRIDAFFVNYV